MPFNVVALVSGGKDSTMNMMKCVSHGHSIVALANIFPASEEGDELDSFMYQTVGHDAITSISQCMEVPMFRRPILRGKSLTTEMEYEKTKGDEVEDLYLLLKFIKTKMPHVNAVASGAILSNYQRTRVEAVCMRLGLTSLSFLWRRNQEELLDEMIASEIDAILVKVACMGLSPKLHLGKSLSQVRPKLHQLNAEFGAHICGEGGEFETFTLDCPLYKHKLVIDEKEVVQHQEDDFAPVAYLRLSKWHVAAKNAPAASQNAPPPSEAPAPDVTIVTDNALQSAGLHETEAVDAIRGEMEGEGGEKKRGFRHFGARFASEVGGRGGVEGGVEVGFPYRATRVPCDVRY